MGRGARDGRGVTPGIPGPGNPPRFFELLRKLCEKDVEFIIIGGFAVTLHGHVRATKDVDIVPNRSLGNGERLWAALVELKAQPAEIEGFRTEEMPVAFEKEGLLRGGNWILYTTLGRLDLMPYVADAEGEIPFAELRESAVRVDLEEIGHPIWVASIGQLIAMKEHANRDIDRIDVTALRMILREDAGA